MGKVRWVVAASAILFAGTAVYAGRLYRNNRTLNYELEQARANAAVVNQFLSLPQVALPSTLSSFWTVRSTERFQEAPIQIVEFGDPLCSDCEVLFKQLQILKNEFPGKINVAYQFFPLEAACNDVVEKNKHPGACDLSYMLASAPDRFVQMHDEIFSNLQKAKTPQWRADFARRYGVETALTDSAVHTAVRQIIATGREYEKTSEKYAHGIRSTPTLIINNRMIIGTLPLPQMRALFQALIDLHGKTGGKFLENWIKEGCAIDSEASTSQCTAT